MVNYIYKNRGFTLAEVLITLGVIGVVAAITMPTLIKHYQHKVLESQFKKNYSQLARTVEMARINLGTLSYNNYNDVYESISSNYKDAKNVSNFENSYKNSTKTYNGLNVASGNRADCLNNNVSHPKRIITNDGSFLGICAHSFWGVMFTIDTNGYKKPNKYGYDIFFLKLADSKLGEITIINRDCVSSDNCGTQTSLSEYNIPCSANSNNTLNGLSCVRYALQNKCPNDASKTYWECLP